MTGKNSHLNRNGGGEWSSRSTSCPSGKWAYPSRALAKRHAKKVGTGLRPYRCDFCPHWHVGHKPAVTMQGVMSAADFHARRVRYAYPGSAVERSPVDVSGEVRRDERDRRRDDQHHQPDHG